MQFGDACDGHLGPKDFEEWPRELRKDIWVEVREGSNCPQAVKRTGRN